MTQSTTKNCEYCGKLFIAKRSSQKYCTRTHYEMANRAKARGLQASLRESKYVVSNAYMEVSKLLHPMATAITVDELDEAYFDAVKHFAERLKTLRTLKQQDMLAGRAEHAAVQHRKAVQATMDYFIGLNAVQGGQK